MFKKLAVFASALLISASASAGYIQYNFSGPISGSFVQHDDNGSIADYRFSFVSPELSAQLGRTATLGFSPQRVGPDGGDIITSETTHFLFGGPTNFNVRDNVDKSNHDSYFAVDFSQNADGSFGYIASYSVSNRYQQGTGTGSQWVTLSASGTLSGLVSQGALTLGSAASYDANGGYDYDVPAIIPTYVGAAAAVPEPASLALFAAGAFALAGLRRRKPAR